MDVNTSRVGHLVKSQKNNRFAKKKDLDKNMLLSLLKCHLVLQSICMQLITRQDGQFNSINILLYNVHNSYRVINLCYYSHLTVPNKLCVF